MSFARKMRRSRDKALAPYRAAVEDLGMHQARVARRRALARWHAALGLVMLAVALFTWVAP